eukprot:4843283-Prorocentrum_lima.AAC.1
MAKCHRTADQAIAHAGSLRCLVDMPRDGWRVLHDWQADLYKVFPAQDRRFKASPLLAVVSWATGACRRGFQLSQRAA